MVRALSLLAAVAAFALAPAARAADVCLLCGDNPGDSDIAGPAQDRSRSQSQSQSGSDPRRPIEIELAAGFNFRRFRHQGAVGELLVDASRQSMTDVGGITGYGLVGQVVIRGAPNAAVSVALPDTVMLTGKHGGRIEVRRIDNTLPKSPRLDGNGRLEFSFSGTLSLPASAGPGEYQASFSIDALER